MDDTDHIDVEENNDDEDVNRRQSFLQVISAASSLSTAVKPLYSSSFSVFSSLSMPLFSLSTLSIFSFFYLLFSLYYTLSTLFI